MIYNWPVNKKMDETWYLNDTIRLSSNISVSIKFKCDNYEFNQFTIAQKYNLEYTPDTNNDDDIDNTLAYHQKRGWLNQTYRTITFLESPTGDLLTWLQQNGVKQ